MKWVHTYISPRHLTEAFLGQSYHCLLTENPKSSDRVIYCGCNFCG
uniref:Uncharacterized protein n=1 Tax=Anguilla anguilla TaxID=7936 RepID=A0A0E9WLV0_ANGAN